MLFLWEDKKNGTFCGESVRTASNIMYFGLESPAHIKLKELLGEPREPFRDMAPFPMK